MPQYIVDEIEGVVAAAPKGLFAWDEGVASHDVHIDVCAMCTRVEVTARRAAVCTHATILSAVEFYFEDSTIVFERVCCIVEVDVFTIGIIVEVALYVITCECVATATTHGVVGASVMGDGFWTTLTSRFLDIEVSYVAFVDGAAFRLIEQVDVCAMGTFVQVFVYEIPTLWLVSVPQPVGHILVFASYDHHVGHILMGHCEYGAYVNWLCWHQERVCSVVVFCKGHTLPTRCSNHANDG